MTAPRRPPQALAPRPRPTRAAALLLALLLSLPFALIALAEVVFGASLAPFF
ncbi:hypothetical protein CLG85_022385 [Yangia mangrovi]|uniref:Uncharacterized protein n=1 Tax=Alloyangia mangrovi TaxID=1779329 RepID=A0ABT2KQ66_9RHOB|nr:hypothetical protein [Alloyangia mangrovi]MCT4372899.1 hypothetical protein [Alloyangia mangrovi]